MWIGLTFSVVVSLVLGTEVPKSEDTEPWEMIEQAENVGENLTDFSSLLGAARPQILAAQFECYLKIIYDPPRKDGGTYCNRTWDGWMCWGDTAPGTAVQMCPAFFTDFDPSEKVTKVCNPDGQWFHHPESNRVWSNYTLCSARFKEKVKLAFGNYYLAVVGNSVSIISLTLSLFLFSFLNLNCQRISLHKNMFASFILKSIITTSWLSLNLFYNKTNDNVSCKILDVLNQYITVSNYFWMLCEGIYLHTLIVVAVFVGEQQLLWYYILGWGFPIAPALTYAVVRAIYHNDRCWMSSKTHILYIPQAPIQVALLVNLFFLLNIVRVLITKLKKTHCAESTTYMKAVRATLILIPLLGVPFILWPYRPEGQISQNIYESFMSIFSNFQGVLVAFIFCFCNGEAQTALKRKWVQWKFAWGKTSWGESSISMNLFKYHTNSSIVETSRTLVSLEQPPPAACS